MKILSSMNASELSEYLFLLLSEADRVRSEMSYREEGKAKVRLVDLPRELSDTQIRLLKQLLDICSANHTALWNRLRGLSHLDIPYRKYMMFRSDVDRNFKVVLPNANA